MSMVREALRERFVETLHELGGSTGNGRLRDALGWQDDTYWSVHAALIEDCPWAMATEPPRPRPATMVPSSISAAWTLQ